MTKTGKKLYWFFGVIAFFSVLVTFLPEMSHSWLGFEILIQARPYLAMVFMVFVLIFALKRYRLLFFVQIFCLLANIYLISASYSGVSVEKRCMVGENVQDIRVLSLNVYYKNTKYAEVVRVIEVSEADIVFLQEVQSGLYHHGHKRLLQKYPFHYSELEKGVEHGKALYSKYPVTNAYSQTLEGVTQRVLQADIEVAGDKISFIGLHSISPKNDLRIRLRNKHIEALTRYVTGLNAQNEDAYMIVAGDFNTTPWHPVMRKFEKQTKLGNNGFNNIVGTWPTWLPNFLTIPIDHVFYSSNFGRSKYNRGLLSGSDHYPIYADLQMCK